MKKRTIFLSGLLLALVLLLPAGVMGQERGPMELNPGPTLVAPVDDYVVPTTNTDSMITFEWQILPEPTTIWYQLWVGVGTVAVHSKWYNMQAPQGETSYIEKVCDIACTEPGAVVVGLKTTVQIGGNGTYDWSVRGYETHIEPDNVTEYAPARQITIDFTPTGMTTDSAADHRGEPTFTWLQDPRATWYQLIVGVPTTPTFTTLHSVWYQINDQNLKCADLTNDGQNNPTCSVRPPLILTNLPSVAYPNNTTYEWYVRAYGPLLATGPFTAAQSFGLDMLQPDGTSFTTFDVYADNNINYTDQPVFVFNDIPNASWYNLVVFKTSNNQLIHNGWYRRSTICRDVEGSMVCEAFPTRYDIPEVYLINGDYYWHVRGWGPGGNGINGETVTLGTTPTPGFSSVRTLLLNFASLAGQAPTPVFPIGTPHVFTSLGPEFHFEWQHLAAGTWYHIEIRNISNQTVFNGWKHFAEPAVECTGNCQWVQPTTTLANGRYWWRIQAWGPAYVSSNWSSPWYEFRVNVP